GQFFRGFHALRHHPQVQASSHTDDRGHDRGFARSGGDLADERLVLSFPTRTRSRGTWYTRGNLMQMASIPLIFVGGAIGYAGYEAAGLALPLTFLHFSRGFEAEADYLGLQYMYKSGYDPQAFIAFFEKVQAQEKKKPGSLAKAFSTHPQTPDRIEKSQEEIA